MGKAWDMTPALGVLAFTLITAIAAGGVAWGTARSAISQNAKDISALQSLETNVVEIQITQGIASTERAAMTKALDRVEGVLERMESRLSIP